MAKTFWTCSGHGKIREAAKNSYFFSGPATKRGGRVRPWPLETKLKLEKTQQTCGH